MKILKIVCKFWDRLWGLETPEYYSDRLSKRYLTKPDLWFTDNY